MSSKQLTRVLAVVALCVLACTAAQAQGVPRDLADGAARVYPTLAQHGMVASQEGRATRIGVDVLERGGNAVDAAVAIGFALAVTLPRAGNIGGGGFMLLHLADRSETKVIDYRETAPAAASPDMFIDENGGTETVKARRPGLTVGVPGTVAGLALAFEKYGSGRFSWAELIAPAIRLAREGIPVADDVADTLARAQPRIVRWPASARIFLKPDGVALGRGDILVQSDLAATLDLIAREGPRAFYEGPVADKIVASVREAGGIITHQDLARYRAVERAPVHTNYRGYDVLSMPPPSSGGVHILQMLNILEGFPMRETGAGSAASLHLLIETMKLAYADRAQHLADPDFVPVPVRWLTSKRYAAELRAGIDPQRARPSQDIRAGEPAAVEGDNTTHFSIVDRFGNAVANTYTLNLNYGLGLVAEGAGFLLNDELDDFDAKPGTPNAVGFIGSGANAPAPGKRPLSSMSPTIILKDGRVHLVTGSPGGIRIINTVLQVIVNVLDHEMNLAEAIYAPRLHHQWIPDEVLVEPGFSPDTLALLRARGHTIKPAVTSGSANSVMVFPGMLAGATDGRQRGTLAAGH